MTIEPQGLARIDVTRVYEVYSGRHGCACGCRGKYTCTTDGVALGVARRGYDNGIAPSDKTVAMIVRKMNEAIASGIPAEKIGDGQICVETETRLYFAFLKI